MAPGEWFAFLCVCLALLWSLCREFRFSSRPKTLVVLHILENEDETSRCARIRCDGVSNLREFRAFLAKKPSRIPWPFDFYDSKLKTRIAAEWEQRSPLESYDHVMTVIRSHGRQAMVEKEFMEIVEPTTVEVSSDVGSVNSSDDKKDAIPLIIPSVSMAPVACDPISTPHYQEHDLHEETSCPKLEPKHKVFLSHSGVQKRFVAKLCKLLEAHDHYPFFDQRPDSLPKGKKFSALIIDAAKNCQVAVVVLSEDYLSSKWPMIELAQFVRASKSGDKNLNLLPLFYKASVSDLDDESIKDKWRPKWMELAGVDPRVDPEEWAEAVRELRRVNGLNFHKFENSDSYRDAIVKDIFRLAPPDLLFDTSKILGRERICEFLADKFQPDPKTSASVLGLYGMGGLGKTTISKSLCNHFNQEFLGRVCYIEMKEGMGALERQQMVMRKLLRPDELILQSICDASQGWNYLKNRMKENPVFLVIDDVQPDDLSKEEALEYLNVEYSSQSKIMVVSRSLDVVENLLGDPRYCWDTPRLKREEAAGIFLQQGAPKLEYSSLTGEERGIVERCLGEAWFPDQDLKQTNTFLHRNEGGQYHPLALRALGAYFHDRSKTSEVLSWDIYLDEYRKLKATGESYDTLFQILGLQFNTLDKMTQFMFLDIVLYAPNALESPMLSNSPLEDMIAWVANIREVGAKVVEHKISYFKKCAMLNIEGENIIVHDLYKEYATWFLEHIVNSGEVVGVCCVRKFGDTDNSGLPLELRSSPCGTCWQELRRIRLENISCHGFAVKKFQEWQNVVVLQISECKGLTTLNLQGLRCIRHLELRYLRDLQTLTLTGDESTSPDTVSQATCAEPKQWLPRPWLQFVIIEGLSSLERLPSFSPFTSLKFLEVVNCTGLTQPPRVQYCSGLKRMQLQWYPKQKTLPSVDGLTSLQDLAIYSGYSEPQLDEALKLEGLSSLISLGALELRSIPVGDLNGLESLTNVEFIFLSRLYRLVGLPPLESLARSSLHVLRVLDCNVKQSQLKGLNELQQLIKLKIETLAAQGQIVPHTPSKIGKLSLSIIELRMSLCCEACAREVRKKLQKLEGVEKSSVRCDMYENKVTVMATTKPKIVLKQAMKVKKDAVIWQQFKKREMKNDENPS